MIQIFGAPGVFGRVLSVREMRRMHLAKRITDAVEARAGSDNWAEWAEKNPEDRVLLDRAVKAAYGS